MRAWLRCAVMVGAVGIGACDADPSRDSSADAGASDMAASAVDADSSDAQADAGASTELSLDELEAEIAGLLCERPECLSFGETAFLRAVSGDLVGDACRERLTPTVRALGIFVPRALFESGGATYNAGRARECIESLRSAPGCGQLFGGEGSCLSSLFDGALVEGAECSLHQGKDFCVRGTACAMDPSLPSECPGRCVDQVPVGHECTTSAQCEAIGPYESAFCGSGDFPGERCIGRRRVLVGVGEACDLASYEGFVETMFDCESGLSCEFVGGPVRTCVAPPDAGPPDDAGAPDDAGPDSEAGAEPGDCGPSEPCAGGGVCLGETCADFAVRDEAGAPCSVSEDGFALCDLGLGLACDVVESSDEALTGTCVEVGDGTEGSVCVLFARELGAPGDCGAGFFCDGDYQFPTFAGTCVAQRADGDECDDDRQCATSRCLYDNDDERSVCGALVCEE